MNLIAAVAKNGVIGRGGQLPWHLPEDLRYFKNMTMGCSVIMGRKTFESLGKALPGRVNIVVSTSLPRLAFQDIHVVHSLQEAEDISWNYSTEAYVIGGAEMFNLAIPECEHLFLTEIQGSFEGDTYFPILDRECWREVDRVQNFSSTGLEFHFVEYRRRYV